MSESSGGVATRSVALRRPSTNWELVRTVASQTPPSPTGSKSEVHKMARSFGCTLELGKHNCRPVVLSLSYTSESPGQIKNGKTLRPYSGSYSGLLR